MYITCPLIMTYAELLERVINQIVFSTFNVCVLLYYIRIRVGQVECGEGNQRSSVTFKLNCHDYRVMTLLPNSSHCVFRYKFVLFLTHLVYRQSSDLSMPLVIYTVIYQPTFIRARLTLFNCNIVHFLM